MRSKSRWVSGHWAGQGYVEFAIGIAVVVVFAAIGFNQLSSAVYYYFTGDRVVNQALNPTPGTPTATPTVGPSPTPTPSPTAGPPGSPTPTPTATLVPAAAHNALTQIGNCDPAKLRAPLPWDALPVIDVSTRIQCEAIVQDPLDTTAHPAGWVLLETTALGGDPGVGDFVIGGVQQTLRTGVRCALVTSAVGSKCTFEYDPSFSGLTEPPAPACVAAGGSCQSLLRQHHLRATYSPAAGSNLFSTTSAPLDLRVRRNSATDFELSDCSPRPLRAGSVTTCEARVVDQDTGPRIAPAGTLTWVRLTGPGPVGFSANPCTVNTGTQQCTVGINPDKGGDYWFQVRYTPDASDPYHSASNLLHGAQRISVNDKTVTRILGCLPNSVAANAATVCSVEIENVTGTSVPTGTINWTFAPSSSVTPAPCSTPSTTIVHCDVTYTAPVGASSVTLSVSFTAAIGSFYVNSDSGPPITVLTVT